MEHLPENCIMKVLTFAGPQESCRLAILSTIFKSASQFDGLWVSFLPPDYQTLISQSSNPSLRHLVVALCHHPILIRNATMSLMVDKRTGKNIVMMSGATELSITWGNNPEYWQLRSDDPDSRFPQVAELLKVCWFEISARLDLISSGGASTTLSPKSLYAAYFVFKMSSRAASGFENRPVEAEVKVSGSAVSKGVVFFEGEGGGGGRPTKRGDGWCEVKIGEFWTPAAEEEERCLDLKLLNRTGNWKKGVIVQGIELRPC
ncbi:F-box protein At2g02240 [Linum grandiflorum]